MYDGNTCITTESITEYTRDAEEHVTIATRPLAIQKNGTWYTYGLDLTKNVCEVFGSSGYIGTAYTYSPYGEVSATGNVERPIQWSSETFDIESNLVYYNYMYYSSCVGRLLTTDTCVSSIKSIMCQFNAPLSSYNVMGLYRVSLLNYVTNNKINKKPVDLKVYAPSPLSKAPDFAITTFMVRGETEVNSINEFKTLTLTRENECLKNLTLIAHGVYTKGGVVSMQIGITTLGESNTMTDISDLISSLEFCDNCYIKLVSCHLGLSPYLNDRLSKKTGCKIKLYKDKVRPWA